MKVRCVLCTDKINKKDSIRTMLAFICQGCLAEMALIVDDMRRKDIIDEPLN